MTDQTKEIMPPTVAQPTISPGSGRLRETLIIIGVCFIAILLAIGVSPFLVTGESRPPPNVSRDTGQFAEQVKKLQMEIAALQEKVDSGRRQREQLEKEVKDVQAKEGSATPVADHALETLQAQIAELNRRLAEQPQSRVAAPISEPTANELQDQLSKALARISGLERQIASGGAAQPTAPDQASIWQLARLPEARRQPRLLHLQN